ncbi:unnamed protein product [Penicillium salamii]|nr:unnamed protein product [Penicillium salamii]CAG8329416.1 unnamed protein product [Penicillium salamii]
MLSHSTDSLLASVLLCLLPAVLFFVWRLDPQRRDLPVINPRDPWSLSTGSARLRFLLGAPALIKQGLSKVLTDDGPQVVLAPEFTKEIRNHNSLSLGAFMYQRFHAKLNAFRPYQAFFEKDEAFIKFIRKKLVPQADLVKPLSDTTSSALRTEWTDNTEWHQVALKSSLAMIIARVLAKTFVGEPLCNNVRWLQIMAQYTVDSVQASEALRKWPSVLRPVMIHILPVCRNLKAEMKEAESLIGAVLEERRLEKEAAAQAGKAPQQHMDAFEWMDQHYKEMGRSCDPVIVQLALAVTGMHTTTDMLAQLLYDLDGKDDLIKALREEVVTVIQREGLTVSSLSNMRLMDSCLKESQRLKPVQAVALQRIALNGFDLSDGTHVPKGTPIILSAGMWDPEVYTSPYEFDGYRFLKMRENSATETETAALAVTPTSDHTGWGLGKHACPGRFLAIHEIKIVLCHLLTQYDFESADNKPPQTIIMGTATLADPFALFNVKRRDQNSSDVLSI